ncbi:MAG: hypothetical protein HXX10_15015 [Rhodoplanes sp.]|uniref:hypothetical protein n=1 Tax=Rhodoplanes sp. TaxID=1968906 RepID=UPI00184AD9EF|nr:hypothetical protein [Rhodoplanes sp.]NVO15338.1 hypothetical protein [Rhodoplanes sp.]
MRITAAVLVSVVGLLQPALGIAGEQTASFDSRWPEVPMREPTSMEAIRLVASALKEDLEPAIKAELVARTEKPLRCSAKFCGLLTLR